MMVRFELTVPQNYNDGTPVDATTIDTINREIMSYADGCTRLPALGMWNDPDGNLVTEDVWIYRIDAISGNVIRPLLNATADLVRIALGQYAVKLDESEITYKLITAP